VYIYVLGILCALLFPLAGRLWFTRGAPWPWPLGTLVVAVACFVGIFVVLSTG
jgi:hypothetical protein